MIEALESNGMEAAFAVASFRPANAGRTALGRWSSRLEDFPRVQTLSLFTNRYPLQPLPRSAAALRVRVSFTPPSKKRNSTSCLICVVSPSMAPAPPRGRCGLRYHGFPPTSATCSSHVPLSDFRFSSPLPGLRLLGCATPGPLRGRPPLDTAPLWRWIIFTSSLVIPSFVI